MRFPHLLLALLLRASPSTCNYGGHDLFTSLAQLHELWHDERNVVSDMERAIERLDGIKGVLKRYIDDHRALKLHEGEPNFEFLGHPLNSYLLVRHVALGWEAVREDAFKAENQTREIFDRLRQREERKLPSVYDVRGAAFGLSRLHSLYGVDTDKMTREGVIESRLQRSQVGAALSSKPSVRKLDAWDVYTIATQASENTLMNTLTDMLPVVADKLDHDHEQQIEGAALDLFLQKMPNRTQLDREMATAVRVHDEMLSRRGPRGHHRCHETPRNPKLRKKKKHKKVFRLESPVREEATVDRSREQEMPEVQEKTQMQYEMLCSAEHFRDPSEDAGLKCAYAAPAWSAWLKLAPIKLELRSREPYLAVLRELMLPHECDNITAYLTPRLGFPPGRMSNSARNDWTMKNAWPDENDNIYLEKLTRRVEHATNLYASSKLNQSDRFMCGNYGIGGHYGVHPDFYPYDESRFFKPGDSINRVSTVMTVLEAPEAGGATVWPYLGISVFPEKGSAVMWFNTRSDAVPDNLMLHAACPVLLGQKWIGNKWIAYGSQSRQRPCPLESGVRYQGFIPK